MPDGKTWTSTCGTTKLKALNPRVSFIVLVAPNPVHMTFEFNSAVTADCLSKSTLRVAANEVVNHSNIKNIYYWPTLEIYRWISGHRGALFGNEDRASWHVWEAVTIAEIECLTEMLQTSDQIDEDSSKVAYPAQ